MKKKNFSADLIKLGVCLLVWANAVFAGVTAERTNADAGNFSSHAGQLHLRNNTSRVWSMGGVRFTNNGYQITENNTVVRRSANRHFPEPHYDARRQSTEAVSATNLQMGQRTQVVSLAPGWNWGAGPTGGTQNINEESLQVLLRTSNPGDFKDPDGEPPITIDDLRELIYRDLDFYNPNYRLTKNRGTAFEVRYYDSLGVNGLPGAGGFMDTYLGETQLHFVIPNEFRPGSGWYEGRVVRGHEEPFFYMALGAIQELFRIDNQWIFAIGAKETGVGGPRMQSPEGRRIWEFQVGVYGWWQIEAHAGLDKMMGYPQFFPKYESMLRNSVTVTAIANAGRDMEIMNHYMRNPITGSSAERNALLFNSMFISSIFQYVLSDMLMMNNSVCWKSVMEQAKDPYLALSIITLTYNLGEWDTRERILRYLTGNPIDFLNDPNAGLAFEGGNSGYTYQIRAAVDQLVRASQDFQMNGGNGPMRPELIDFEITLDMIRNLFFGDGGTVARQGAGGILLHFHDPENDRGINVMPERQMIWNRLGEAFDILKGRAPSVSSANYISYRYDFLSILRTVKDLLPFNRTGAFNPNTQNFPYIKYDENAPADAKVCLTDSDPEVAKDELYPYATISILPDEDICSVRVDMSDETRIGKVMWTINYDWTGLNEINTPFSQSADGKDAIFKFAIQREAAELAHSRDNRNGRHVWIFAEDAAGNSVVQRREIRFEREFRPPEIQSAAVFETSNPAVGNPNLLKAAITRNDFTDLKNSNNVTYSWRWNTPTSPIQQIPATAISTSQNGDTLLANISSNFGWGEGLLIMEFDSLGVNGNPTGVRMTRTRAIEDKVGPAIRRNSVTLRPSDGNSGQFDTLIVEFSEAVKADGVNLLAFKNTAVDSTTIAVAVPHNETTGTTRTFFFPSGSLANNNTPLYDSVKIRFPNPSADDGGIFDIPGIYPLPHNQWVGINPVGRFKHPTISWAGVFEDRNPAVGNTNLLKAVGVLGDTENGRRGFSWSWNGNNENISINREDGDTLFFNVGSFVGSGTGTLTMTYQEKLEDDSWVNAEPITRQIEDRVGPAIITGGARLHVNNGEIGQFDTLILTFSEEIRTFDYPYISLFFSTDASGSNPVAQTTVSTEGRQMFLFAPGQITQDGNLIYSWVKLNRVEATCNGMIPACYKAVYDNAHNPPHENNQWVEIEFFGKFRAPIMISAEVRDEIGDGTANVIVAQITPRDVENLENAKYFYRWNTQTSESSRREPTSVSANGSTLRTNIPADLGFGLGWLIMEYDTLAGAAPWRDSIPLLDKVGPAIKKDGADFFPNNGNSGQFDTLLVEFTEGVVVNGDCALLAFATNDQGANETPVLPHNVIYQGNGVWVFIYNPNSLTTDNKLKFSHVKAGNQVISGERGCTPVLDSESNFPHENSIWVAIKDNTKSTRLPINISAAIFDNRGEQAGRRDGKGDSIFVQFTLAETQVINGVTIPPFTAQMIDSVRIVFAGNTTMAQKNEINVHSNTSFSYTRRNDFPGSGTGTIEIFFTDRITDINGKIEFTRPATINDKVAPVIDSASYVRYDDRPDTLKVWFSEPLSSTGNSPIDAISGRHNLVAVPHLSNRNFAVYVVSNGNFVYGDSIWIVANSGIRDLAHNEQENANNKRVEIKYLRFITLNIDSAAYFDTSYPRDGYIDSINVKFRLATNDEQFAETIRQIVMANEFELPRNRHFTKNNATVNMANGSIGIRVSQDRSSVPVPVTSVSSSDVITVTTPQIRNAGDTLRILLSSGKQIDDSIAPVITAAHFAPMFMKDDDDVIVDTLIVRFSERVTGHVAKEMLKAFKFSTDAEYVIDFEDRNVNSDVAHLLLRTNEATVLPEEGDSIRIESGISDGRNLQNVKTVWVPITIGKTTYVYNLTIYPNPYNPGNFSYENPITDKNNMAVLVRPRGSRKITGELSGSIIILDQLGNKIVDNESFEFRREKGILIWTWDGKNTRGRNVGAGFYQAIIQITNANAKEGEKDTQVYLRKIGIRN